MLLQSFKTYLRKSIDIRIFFFYLSMLFTQSINLDKQLLAVSLTYQFKSKPWESEER